MRTYVRFATHRVPRRATIDENGVRVQSGGVAHRYRTDRVSIACVFAVTQSINAQQFLCLIDCISNCDDYMCIPVLCGSFLRDCSNNRIFGLCRYPGYVLGSLLEMGFRDWSRARMRFSFERFLLPKGSQFALVFACALF